jgi:bacterioferritin (cytochrome b1)
MLDRFLGLAGLPGVAEIKRAGNELQAQFPARWILDTIASAALRELITYCATDPPPTLAKELGISDEVAAIVYKIALKHALTEGADHGE